MSIELAKIQVKASCGCGARINLEFVGVPFNTIGDIDKLSAAIGEDLEKEGWSDEGDCPECLLASDADAAVHNRADSDREEALCEH